MFSAEILPQLLINGLIAGAIYSLCASGFSLVYFVAKFQYFSHGAVIGIAAYSFYQFFIKMSINLAVACILTIIVSILVALLTNFLIYKPLRRKNSTPNVILIASIVLLIFSTALILAIFGSSTKSIGVETKVIDLGAFTITSVQILIIIFAMILFLVLFYVLKKTKIGKSMRAVADNKDVSKIVGINPEKIYIYTFIFSAVLGAVAGILIGIEQNLYPRMGVLIMVKGFISSVVGGLGSVPGSILGGFLIGLAENIGIWFLPSGYKDVISFSVLLIFLLFRPNGILGVRMRDDS